MRTQKFLKERGIEHVSEPDDGIGDAFNKGIHLALKKAADYIMFINSGDIVINSSYVERAIPFLEKNRMIDFTYGDIVFKDRLVGNIYVSARECDLGRGMHFCHQTMIYRKNIFEQVGLFDNSYRIVMDYEHLCRMNKIGMKGIHILASPFIIMDGRGISSTREWKSIRECCVALFKNGMFVENIWGLLVRTLFFVVRKILMVLKLHKTLANLKRRKYSVQAPRMNGTGGKKP